MGWSMVITIKTKLSLVFGGYVFTILALLGFSFYSFDMFNRHLTFLMDTQFEGVEYLNLAVRATYDTDLYAVSLLYALRTNNVVANELRRYIESEKRNLVNEYFDKFKERIAQDDPDFKAEIGNFATHAQLWRDAVDRFLGLCDGSELDRAEELLLRGDVKLEFDGMATSLETLTAKTKGYVLQSTKSIRDNLRLSGVIMALIAGLIVALSLVQVLFFHFGIFKNVERISRRLREIAEGEGDLTAKLSFRRLDEFGILSDNFNRFVGKLRESIVAVKVVSDTNSALKDELSTGNEEVSSSVNEISSNLGNIAKTVNSLNETVDANDARIKRLDAEITGLDKEVEKQAGVVVEASSAVNEIAESVNAMTEAAEEQKAAADQLVLRGTEGSEKSTSSSEAVESIKESIAAINETMGIISSIAEQTNILAMNAAIEAAHAGESGKGFTVVADEIRRLAESTSVQSKEISSTLEDMIGRIDRAAEASADSNRSFTSVLEQIEKVASSFSRIAQGMEGLRRSGGRIIEVMGTLREVSRNAKEEANRMREQTAGISGEMTLITHVSKESALAINEINAGINEIITRTQQVNDITRTFSEATDVLVEHMSRFKT
jgi:methyl-accepting chemotaxis protein